MNKIKEFWASLDDVTTISKKELFLSITTCVLAGIVFGFLFSPKKTSIFGSYNGNGSGHDKDDLPDELEEA